MNKIENLLAYISPTQRKLDNHRLYHFIENEEDIRVFMEYHVFAVWDFMSLAKSLQRSFTTVELPWRPSRYPEAARLINEIILEEETDRDRAGKVKSHFELYLEAMDQAKANDTSILSFLDALSGMENIDLCIRSAELPAAVERFLRFTFSNIKEDEPHKVAAAFTFGREGVIPDMFRRIIARLDGEKANDFDAFLYYLDRHIHLDEEIHGPMANRMIESICGNDESKWHAVEETAKQSIEHRILLWDGIADALSQKTNMAARL